MGKKIPEKAANAQLVDLVDQAVETAKKAKKHRASLTGDNFYAEKIFTLRANATQLFQSLVDGSVGETAAYAEMIDVVFAPDTEKSVRLEMSRNLKHQLLTAKPKVPNSKTGGSGSPPQPSAFQIIPSSLLNQVKRGYITILGRQVNDCFEHGCYDACMSMMRRMLEVAIIDVYEHLKIEARIKDGGQNYFYLTDLVHRIIAEPDIKLTRGPKKDLPNLKELGNRSSHGKSFFAKKEDVENYQISFRSSLEELLRLADLLDA